MRGYIATTDYSWFTFLRGRQPLDEVNFWQPSAHSFKPAPGTPFFFKLKKPHYAIGGFGIFARYEAASPALAWDAFGEKNGAATFQEMRGRVEKYVSGEVSPGHRIGCIMVSDPVFFPEDLWVEQPKDWAPNIVSGSGYDLTEGEGRRVWEACQDRYVRLLQSMPSTSLVTAIPVPAVADRPRFGEPMLVRPRLGQGTFRIALTAAYKGACAVSGEHSLPVLEAAHIRPYASDDASHDVANGLLLRADIHRLFDRGYVTVTPDYRFVVSDSLKQEFENGRAYYKRSGDLLRSLPANAADRPDPQLLQWHNENVFERKVA